METNKTNWFAFLRSLEDITRNGKSQLTGAEAFNEFINLLFLKFKEKDIIRMLKKQKNKDSDDEEHDKFLVMGSVDEDFLIKNLFEKYCKLYDETRNKKNNSEIEKKIEEQAKELYSLLYDFNRQYDEIIDYDKKGEPTGTIIKKLNNKKKCVMGRFMHNDDFYNVVSGESKPDNITNFTKGHCFDVVNLIIKIHKTFEDKELSEFDFDAFGEGYEKYTADEVMSAKTWGQYFTRRDVIDLIVEEIKPKYNEKGSDETCGTGGFPLSFDKYVKKNLEQELKSEKITKKILKKNYKEFKNNIYAHELKWSVYKPLMLNLMCKKINLDNIILGSCLDKYNLEKGEIYDFMAGNPPYGGSIEWESHMDGKFSIKVKNSVALILQLYLYKLKKHGRCGLVVDRGILNNGTDKKNAWEKTLRKKLLEENNLYKIILLPTGIFAHTNFATAIIFFTKGEKTKYVEFMEGYFKDEDKGKGNKAMYLKDGVIIDIAKIKKKNYSLKLDDYIDKPKENTDGWVKLGDVVKFDIGGTPSTKEAIYWNGEYNWVSVKELNGKIITDTEKKITKKGIENSSVKLVRKDSTMMSFKLSIGKIGFAGCDMYCNEAIMFFKHENDTTHKFITYCLMLLPFDDALLNGNIGSGSMNKQTLYEIKIPNLSLQHQEKIVTFLDGLYKKYKIEDTVKYFSNANVFNLLIDKQYKEFEELLWYQEQIPRMMGDLAQIPRMKNDYIRGLFNTVESVEYKLGDITKFEEKKLKLQAKNALDSGKYKFYSCAEEVKYYDACEFKNECLIINRGGKSNIRIDSNFAISHDDIYVICVNTKKTSNKFVHTYLKYNLNQLEQSFTGNGLKHISKVGISKCMVKLPSLQDQQKIIDQIEKIDSEQSSYANYTKVLKEQIDNMNVAIKNICNIKKETKEDIKNEVENESDAENSDEKPKLKNIKEKKKKTEKKKVESDSDAESSNSDEKIKKNKKKKVKNDSDTESSDSEEEMKKKIKINKKK